MGREGDRQGHTRHGLRDRRAGATLEGHFEGSVRIRETAVERMPGRGHNWASVDTWLLVLSDSPEFFMCSGYSSLVPRCRYLPGSEFVSLLRGVESSRDLLRFSPDTSLPQAWSLLD